MKKVSGSDLEQMGAILCQLSYRRRVTLLCHKHTRLFDYDDGEYHRWTAETDPRRVRPNNSPHKREQGEEQLLDDDQAV